MVLIVPSKLRLRREFESIKKVLVPGGYITTHVELVINESGIWVKLFRVDSPFRFTHRVRTQTMSYAFDLLFLILRYFQIHKK